MNTPQPKALKRKPAARFVPVSALELVATPPATATSVERRAYPRFTVDPMYSAVHVVRAKHALDGHIYEVGLGGMRFELDRAVPKGSTVAVALELPGCLETIHATGTIVRVFDRADDPGPRRMVVEFESFAEGSRAVLERYLAQNWLRVAPTQFVEELPKKRATTVATVSSRGSSRTTTRSASAA